MVNNWQDTYVKMDKIGINIYALSIMNDNDILQTKYVAYMYNGITLSSSSIGDSLHIVIDNVTKNMGTTLDDAKMIAKESTTTTITINDDSDSGSLGTWTSTIVPENVKVELNCKVVKDSKSFIIAKCGRNQWINSVFNRIPIRVSSNDAEFGSYSYINRAMFGTSSFSKEGLIPSLWNESIQYIVDGRGSDLIIGSQLTIKNLPESFVRYWVIIVHAKAYMGNGYAMLVPPE